jgi:HEAT repeat protein
VKCLVKFLINEFGDEERRKEIARKIIPCLTDPGWATKEDRAALIVYLSEFNMPELAPGLIWILDYDGDPDKRAAAANALARYRDPRAIPALRRALEKEKIERWRRLRRATLRSKTAQRRAD